MVVGVVVAAGYEGLETLVAVAVVWFVGFAVSMRVDGLVITAVRPSIRFVM